MLEIKKVILVAGAGGARMDFVAGWLSTLPLFLDTTWRIDPQTGLSHGSMMFTKMLDYGKIVNFSDFFKEFFIINPAADLYYAGTLHGYKPENIQNAIESGQAELVSIDTSSVSTDHLAWEFVVKTYFPQFRTRGAIETNMTWQQIDRSIKKSEITNQDRIALVEQQLQSLKNQPLARPGDIQLPHKTVAYNLLFQPGGSKYLCKTLNLPAIDSRYHAAWDCYLPLTVSPTSLVVWGRTWNKADYFNEQINSW